MQINWLYIGLSAFVVYLAIFGYFLLKKKWTRAGIGVALANLLMVMLNLVAPFRGVLDPHYAGYNIGLIHVEPGEWVTVVSGLIVVCALASACISVLNLRGRAMTFVAVVDSILLLLIGLPILIEGLANSADYKIELGEYLFIPGIIAVLLSAMFFTLPLAASVVWSARRIRRQDH